MNIVYYLPWPHPYPQHHSELERTRAYHCCFAGRCNLDPESESKNGIGGRVSVNHAAGSLCFLKQSQNVTKKKKPKRWGSHRSFFHQPCNLYISLQIEALNSGYIIFSLCNSSSLSLREILVKIEDCVDKYHFIPE